MLLNSYSFENGLRIQFCSYVHMCVLLMHAPCLCPQQGLNCIQASKGLSEQMICDLEKTRTSMCLCAGSGLKGAEYNITVAWQSVPWTGLLLTGRKSFAGFKMPQEYTGSRDQSRRWAL